MTGYNRINQSSNGTEIFISYFNRSFALDRMRMYDIRKNPTVDADKSYFIFKITKFSFFRIDKEFLEKYTGTVLNDEKRALLVKAENLTRKELKFIVTRLDLKSDLYKPESLTSVIDEYIAGISTAMQVVRTIGRIRNVGEQYTYHIGMLISNLVSLMSKIASVVTRGMLDIADFVESCISLYNVVATVAELKNAWNGESLTLLLPALSLFMPKNLLEIIKRINMFSNIKFLDDPTLLYSFFHTAMSYVTCVLDLLPSWMALPAPIKDVLASMTSLTDYLVLAELDKLYSKWRSYPKVVLELEFRTGVKSCLEKVNASMYLKDWARRSVSISTKLSNFDKLVKCVAGYEKSSRTEPVCIIIEGPPGNRKSVLMNSMISTLNMSNYSHLTKPIIAGKDFYDSYNNEEIFFMDDVGQMGVSQWNNIINFVSPVKMPLDCAAAELKDTKFFNSDVLLITTNKFSGIQSVTAQDGIGDLKALWRRGLVLDFADVRAAGDWITGICKVKYFDVFADRWIYDFPKDLADFHVTNGWLPAQMDVCCKADFIAWTCDIVRSSNIMKKKQNVDNSLTVAQLDVIRSKMKYAPEGLWATGLEYLESLKEKVVPLITVVKETLVSHIASFIEILSDLLETTTTGVKLIIVGAISMLWMFKYYFFSFGKKENVVEEEVFKKESDDAAIKAKITTLAVPDISLHSKVQLIKNQVFEADFHFKEHVATVIVLWSGSCLVTVGHVSTDEEISQVVVYKDKLAKYKLLDHTIVKRVYYDKDCDVSVWRLPVGFCKPFKDLVDIFKGSNSSDYFVHPVGVVPLFKILAPAVDVNTTYSIRGVYECTLKASDVFYHLREDGLCGSVICDVQGNLVGFHVAGNVSTNTGVALRLRKDVLVSIASVLSVNRGTNFEVQVSQKILPDFSGIKLAENFHKHSAKKSSLVQSPYYGMFDITRRPANLLVNGNHTIKDSEKKSFSSVANVDMEELEFARKVMLDVIPPYVDIPMQTVIKGNEFLSPLNKKSSNGHGLQDKKEVYVDYLTGKLRPEFAVAYESFLDSIDKEEVDINTILWTSSLKDELRDVSKVLPRSFRVSTLYVQLLTKTMFGDLTVKLMQNRDKNQILIGVNPFSDEWGSIEQTLTKHGKFWAGDIKNWDGNMLPQAQHVMNEVLVERFKGTNINRLQFILTNMAFTPVAINDDTYITNHSMPSGSFLTATYNSLINRFYTAMWYFRNMQGLPRSLNPIKFNEVVLDYVYGDDKLNVLRVEKHKDRLNACTMRDFFLSIGMDFTTSTKGIITEPFQDMSQITLLKRTFTYHPILKKIVGPLDLNTIFSSVSWIDKDKDMNQVMYDKLHVFQREAYLHYSLYPSLIAVVKKFSADIDYPFVELSEKYLLGLYESGLYGKDIMDDYLFSPENVQKESKAKHSSAKTITVIREPTASGFSSNISQSVLRQEPKSKPLVRKGEDLSKSNNNKYNVNGDVTATKRTKFVPESGESIAVQKQAYDSELVTRLTDEGNKRYNKLPKLVNVPMELKMDYSRFHKKPIFVKNISWNTDAITVGTDLGATVDFPHGAFVSTNKALAAPFDFSALYRMKACFLLQVLGTPMHQGCLLASVFPKKLVAPVGSERAINSALNSPHAFLHANSSTPVCIEIPFYSVQMLKPSFVSTAGAYDAENNADYAFLRLTVIDPLQTPAGASAPLKISVHVMVDDSEFFVPTNFDATYKTESKTTLKSIGKYSNLLNNGFKVVAGDLIDMATSKFHALTGFHDPADSTIDMRILPTPVANLHNVDQEQKIVRLDPHSQHFRMYDDYYFCTDVDEMAISHIVSKPQYLGRAKVMAGSTADAEGTLIFSNPIYPRTSYLGNGAISSNLDAISYCSRYWRGGLKLHIMSHMSEMHVVKLLVVKSYTPPDNALTAYPEMGDVVNYQSTTVEFSGGGQVQVVDLPYCACAEQLFCTSDPSTIALQHGIVYVYVQTPAVTNSTVVNSIHFSFFLSGAEDLQFYGYSTDGSKDWLSESQVTTNVIEEGDKMRGIEESKLQIYSNSFAPNVSIRDYLRRLTPMYYEEFLVNGTVNNGFLIPLRTIFSGSSSAIRTAHACLMKMFFGIRGGFRFRIKVATMDAPTTNVDSYLVYIPPGSMFTSTVLRATNPLVNDAVDLSWFGEKLGGDCIKIRPQYQDKTNIAVFECEVPDMTPYNFKTTRVLNGQVIPNTGIVDAIDAWGHFWVATGTRGTTAIKYRVTVEVAIADETRLGFQVNGPNGFAHTNVARTEYITYFNTGTTSAVTTIPTGKSYLYRKS